MVWTTVACVLPSMALTHARTCGYPTAEAVILIPPLLIIGVFVQDQCTIASFSCLL